MVEDEAWYKLFNDLLVKKSDYTNFSSKAEKYYKKENCIIMNNVSIETVVDSFNLNKEQTQMLIDLADQSINHIFK